MSNREDPNEGIRDRFDMNFDAWFASDCILANIKTEIGNILVKPMEGDPIPGSDSSEDEEGSA